jgi:hypothetical protein
MKTCPAMVVRGVVGVQTAHGSESVLELAAPTRSSGTRRGTVAADLAVVCDDAALVGSVPWFDERHLQPFLRQHGPCANPGVRREFGGFLTELWTGRARRRSAAVHSW